MHDPASPIEVQALFKKHFGHAPPHVARAPASLELLGSLAEFHEGLALAAAVNRYAFVAVAPRTDGRIEVAATGLAEREKFWMSDPAPNPAARWAEPFKAVLRYLRKQAVPFRGFNAALHHAIPTGAGLGEIAALAVATALAVRKLYPYSLGLRGATLPPRRNDRGELPPLPRAERQLLERWCTAALDEVEPAAGHYVHLVASLLGRDWHLLLVDCRFGSVEPAPLIGAALVLCDAGGDSPLADVPVALRSPALAQKLGLRSLRSLEPRALRQQPAALDSVEWGWARHLVGENQFVAAAERALREEDHRQLGAYLTRSHDSLRALLGPPATDVDRLNALAGAHRACWGSRLAGGDARCVTVHLVPHHGVPGFVEHMQQSFARQTGRPLRTRVLQPANGAV